MNIKLRLYMPSQKTIDLNLLPDEAESREAATKDNCANSGGGSDCGGQNQGQHGNDGMNDIITDMASSHIGGMIRDTDKNGKREDYLSWEDYFMAMANLSSLRSKDPVTQVGACIVDHNKRIVGIGYNGMPVGCSDDELPWSKTDELENKYMYVCHAGVNAIMNKNTDVFGCTLYTTLFPCNECAKVIIQAGIKSIIYASDRYKVHYQSAKKMLDMAGVKYSAYNQIIKKKEKDVVINFGAIDFN